MIDYASTRNNPPAAPLPLRALTAAAVAAGWMLLGLVAVAGPTVLAGFALSPAGGYIAIFAVLAFLVVSSRCARAARRRQAMLLLGYLEQAVRLNLPLSPILLAAERGETPAVARRLSHLRAYLEDGAPVGDALAAAAPGVPRRTAEMLNAGERSGRLPAALHRAYRDELADAEHDPARGAFVTAYVLIVVVSIAGTMGLVGIFVMPKFEQIFKDFRIRLPDVTIATLRVTANLALPLTIAAFLLLCWLCGRAMRGLLRSRPAPGAFEDLFQRVTWGTPVFGKLARDRGLADVCTTIADAVEAGRPAPDALAEAQLPHVNIILRERVARWAELVAKGEGLADAARHAWMPSLLCGLLRTAQPGDLANVFRFLARYYDARFSRLAMLLRSAVVPLLSIGFGVLAAFVALSIFLPIIKLVETVTPLELRP